MKKNQLIIILALAALIIAGIFAWSLLPEREEKEQVVSEDVIPADAEENFYSYLELASFSGKFMGFDKDNSKLTILYFNTETMKINSQSFRVDAETVFSKAAFEPYQPNIFARKDLEKIKPETVTKVFYLPAEEVNQLPLARLIQVEALF